MKSENVTATYTGGLPGVVVALPSGRTLEFVKGKAVPILASEVEALANHPEFVVGDTAAPTEEVTK
jgi:hypothetical protein